MYQDLIHTLTPITPGDFTLDGDLNADNYSLWQSTYGPTGISEADWDRNGTVDTADYVVWRNNVVAVSVSNSLAAVPEPKRATLVLPMLIVAIAARNFGSRRPCMKPTSPELTETRQRVSPVTVPRPGHLLANYDELCAVE
jgi:hypothetical protein